MNNEDLVSESVEPGTIAHEAMQFLRIHGESTITALSTGIGRSAKRLSQHLSPALRAGLLARRIENGFAFWRLGPNADCKQAPNIEPNEKTVVKVSALAAPSVFAYADQRAAAPFSVALHTDGRACLERHGRLIAELTNEERLILVEAACNGVKPC